MDSAQQKTADTPTSTEATETMLRPDELEDFVGAICRALGANNHVATEVARHLIGANLAGHDSHGVIRISQYVADAARGDLVPSTRPELIREHGPTALFDAHRGFGHFSTRIACDWAAEHAREYGIAAAAVRHSSHIGRLGDYAEQLAGQGLVGLVTVGMAGARWGITVLPGTSQCFLGANPWAFGIPAAEGAPVIVDVSTSTVAEGKLRVARAKGEPIPEGWIVDAEGDLSRDPNDFYGGGGLLPLGGVVAGHKGYGLGLVSVLCAALALISDPEVAASPESTGEIGLTGVFLAVIDPEVFGDRAGYAALVSEVVAAIKDTSGAEGQTLIPGDIERNSRERRRHCLPIPEQTWQELSRIGDQFGVAAPRVL